MADKVIIVDSLEMDSKVNGKVKRSLKRKADEVIGHFSEERECRIAEFRSEMDGLFKYFREILNQKVAFEESECGLGNSLIACLLEESRLPFSKLVEGIYEKLKEKEGITLASVRSSVLFVGQRLMYGVANADADVLEDDSESCLWCWETREMKLLPKAQRGILNVRRICRKKIHERITALSAMILALQMAESHHNYKMDLMKASDKLGKALNEAHIRSLVESLLQRNSADMAEKEAKFKEKELIKELERKKREVEKDKKRMDRELQKEKCQSEKELKRMQDEAEKEERHREKEEAELNKQLKRQRVEAEKDQRRREKEEAEIKKQLAIKKQATLMERFLLKSKKDSSDIHDDRSSRKALASDSSGKNEDMLNAITLSMDCALSHKDSSGTDDLLKLQLVSWHKLNQSIVWNKSQHWGIRRKPKTSLIKELKLQGSSSEAAPSGKVTTPSNGNACSEVNGRNESSPEKLIDGWEETVVKDLTCRNVDTALTEIQVRYKTKKLLQFDKSHRPAYYGTLSRKSDVVGPRHPFEKDLNLDYDIDSDEEWEEEDPGESLSDCDKDDEEEKLEEGNLKSEDEDGSEDGFLVPDGYLSENEGVQIDSMEDDATNDKVRSSPTCVIEGESEEFRAMLRQQKYLYNLTENALRKNHPLIISNLLHEKGALMMTENLSGISKLEQICLQALSMRYWPGGTSIEISTGPTLLTENQEVCPSHNKGNTTSTVPAAVILDSDLPKIVESIQTCSHGINKVVESLQKKFPTIPKRQLRNKVREISDFVDNRWQVKKEILDKLGLSLSPEKSIVRTKGIAMFFSKRCMPSAGETLNDSDSSPQPCRKREPLQSELGLSETL
ncbi:chromatin assembly factor-1 (FASCIATA1) (FAS1) [Tasmannia lanceolata]|uniref:chromatin assembly factor-1 (FASCIATA1) (FAS1) n=1 Tax=Tasmannia lanceolata TaxID=3420 RepID=UPI004063774C